MPPDPREYLARLGWDMSHPADPCWLDCAKPGYRKEIVLRGGRRREIILCVDDALALESGAFEGDYTGAAVPSDSWAIRWPFMDVLPEAG
jgi:hypothetical protein